MKGPWITMTVSVCPSVALHDYANLVCPARVPVRQHNHAVNGQLRRRASAHQIQIHVKPWKTNSQCHLGTEDYRRLRSVVSLWCSTPTRYMMCGCQARPSLQRLEPMSGCRIQLRCTNIYFMKYWINKNCCKHIFILLTSSYLRLVFKMLIFILLMTSLFSSNKMTKVFVRCTYLFFWRHPWYFLKTQKLLFCLTFTLDAHIYSFDVITTFSKPTRALDHQRNLKWMFFFLF